MLTGKMITNWFVRIGPRIFANLSLRVPSKQGLKNNIRPPSPFFLSQYFRSQPALPDESSSQVCQKGSHNTHNNDSSQTAALRAVQSSKQKVYYDGSSGASMERKTLESEQTEKSHWMHHVQVRSSLRRPSQEEYTVLSSETNIQYRIRKS